MATGGTSGWNVMKGVVCGGTVLSTVMNPFRCGHAPPRPAPYPTKSATNSFHLHGLSLPTPPARLTLPPTPLTTRALCYPLRPQCPPLPPPRLHTSSSYRARPPPVVVPATLPSSFLAAAAASAACSMPALSREEASPVAEPRGSRRGRCSPAGSSGRRSRSRRSSSASAQRRRCGPGIRWLQRSPVAWGSSYSRSGRRAAGERTRPRSRSRRPSGTARTC
jgi:hypothetical protein